MASIHKDMTIAHILESHPKESSRLIEMMGAYGLNCVGCQANTMETLEQGVLGHGLGEIALEELLEELNKIVEEMAKASSDEGFELILTDAAIARIKDMLSSEENTGKALRIAVQAGGCAGASYDMGFKSEPEQGDMVLENQGIKLFIEKDSADLLNGLEINYTTSLMESGFKFNNPNATGACGCGTSFSY